MHLTMVLPDGTTSTEPLSGPGGKIRVAVGEPGKRSSVWTVFAGRRSGDVYVTARALGQALKISLHQTGDWRTQFLTSDIAERWTGERNRIRDQWERPPATQGCVRAVQVRVPHRHLSDVTDDDAGDGVLWLPEAAPRRLACLDVAIVSPDGNGFGATAMPVAGFMLGTGEAVLVLYSTHELTKEHVAPVEDAISRAPVSPKTRDNLAAADSPRMGLFGYDESSGLRIVWDLAIIPGAIA